MKIRYIFTVVRESECPDSVLKDEIDFFNGAMQDETGEYLYGAGSGKEKITVEMEVLKGENWENIDGTTRYDC